MLISRQLNSLSIDDLDDFQDHATDALNKLPGKTLEYVPIEQPTFEAQMSQRDILEWTHRRIAGFYSDIIDAQLDEVTDNMAVLLGRKPSLLKDGLKILFALIEAKSEVRQGNGSI